MLAKMRKAGVIILILTCIVLYFQNLQMQKENNKFSVNNLQLSSKLKQIVEIGNGQIKVVYKDKDRIVTKYVYVSPGDNSTVITTDNDGKVNITNQKFGFTLVPWVGVGVSNGPAAQLGVRFFHFNRVGVAGGLEYGNGTVRPNIGVDYHINYGIINNSALGVYYSPEGIGANFKSFF